MVFTVSELKAIHNLATIYCSVCQQSLENFLLHRFCTYRSTHLNCLICQLPRAPTPYDSLTLGLIKLASDSKEYPQYLVMYICPTCIVTQNFIKTLLENSVTEKKANVLDN